MQHKVTVWYNNDRGKTRFRVYYCSQSDLAPLIRVLRKTLGVITYESVTVK